ncbi:uncharacterized protein LOC135086117 isoform X3 [Ostrinia nubilalis]|uniref:uncharacterized protein LOC135086117 isoform X3 n=1 Tax=Ostrinia nubilalis TaxID=29057 RepID=UPI0030825EFB
MNSALKTGSEYEFSNICCCCLKSDCFKDISSEYEFSGHKEVYGDMLNETFHLQVPKHFPEDYIVQLICDQCIVQLREAYAFRSRMLDSQAVILQRWDQFQSRRSEGTTQETDSTLVTEIKLEVEPEAGCDDGETGADIYQEVDEILQNIKMELVENSEKVTRKRKGNGRRAKQKKCKIEDESEDEVELPTDKVNTTINCPTEEAPHCLPAENEVTVDIMPAVNYPVTSGSKEAKKTQLKAVNCQSECITNKQYAIQQSHMIQIVSDLANQMAEINRKLDLLLARSGETFSPTDDNPGLSELLASLPVKDIASFNNFDDHLKINKDKQAIMSFLSGIGGRNVRSLTTNMLRRIILDDVAELYSLTGKQMKNSNKKSFMSTETYKLIFQICRKIYEDVTEDSLKEIISDWLNQAKVRLSRRAERQNKEKNQ